MTIPQFEFYAGEGRWIKTVVTKDGSPLDVSGAIDLSLKVKKSGESAVVYEAGMEKFDIDEAADGIIQVNLPKSVTEGMNGTYEGGIEVTLVEDSDVMQCLFKVKVKQSVLT